MPARHAARVVVTAKDAAVSVTCVLGTCLPPERRSPVVIKTVAADADAAVGVGAVAIAVREVGVEGFVAAIIGSVSGVD
jgi:energy-converting hydrogenase Eha subunit A